jgi:hypothetical protein
MKASAGDSRKKLSAGPGTFQDKPKSRLHGFNVHGTLQFFQNFQILMFPIAVQYVKIN